ncbi:S26 family signal peptidase [Coprobacter tertius]|uniref:Signal peptidase I n=1 Tax=Coprobacter tertius TaxID=2944915 RepID=A0ABT1MFC0_9BACT|nr:S26 family signal peptidase [Coprobacter tertius]MCP9610571.1 S26 family signal peptidase [Coprobacter tertius]
METKQNENISPDVKNEDKENRFKGIKTSRWVRFALASLAVIAFAIWLGNYTVLLLIVLFFDVYISRFIPWGFWRTSKNSVFRKTMEWVDAILYALVAVYLINTFFFQNYKIPSSSLEKSLLVGDYLFVSKLSFGPRVPNTPLSFPLAQHTLPVINTKSYIEWPQWPYHRLKGTGKVERNDIVVFNFPAGDTVAILAQNPDYYTNCFNEGKRLLSSGIPGFDNIEQTPEFAELCFEEGRKIVNRDKARFGDIVYRPVDRRENYVKRCIGMPGDTLSMRNNLVYINGKELKNPKELQQNYLVVTNGTLFNEQNYRDLNISVEDRQLLNRDGNPTGLFEYVGIKPNANGTYNPVYEFPLTQESLANIKKYNFVTEVIPEPGILGGDVYPIGFRPQWTRSDYGPIWIPAKGSTLKLTTDILPIYERIIRNYEGNKLQVKDSVIYINDKPADSYTFKMDYYWMMGDNRDKSADSRYWGFVPEDHVVGKPLFVWLSIDKDRSLFDGRIRFNRLFKRIGKD